MLMVKLLGSPFAVVYLLKLFALRLYLHNPPSVAIHSSLLLSSKMQLTLSLLKLFCFLHHTSNSHSVGFLYQGNSLHFQMFPPKWSHTCLLGLLYTSYIKEYLVRIKCIMFFIVDVDSSCGANHDFA